MFWQKLIHRHKYKIVNVTVQHTYLMVGGNETYPAPVNWPNEKWSNDIVGYRITSVIALMCVDGDKLHSEHREGNWAHLMQKADTDHFVCKNSAQRLINTMDNIQ